ncbi:hypothetical protein BDB01DRAFT_304355 [Pilobolus umbonatus]|nr:hypothetical protein BDB01DRAFT_304355 [Pilobolus umbonatus]
MPGPKTNEQLSAFYYKLFDFSKVGFNTQDKLYKRRKVFSNVTNTDGYSVSFLFTKITTKNSKDHLPLKPSDL